MLVQKFVLGYSTRLMTQLVSMAVGILVARIAGPTILGTVAFGMSFVSMFTIFANLGTEDAHIKLVSEGRNLGDCIKTYLVIKFFLVLLFVMLVISYLFIQVVIFKLRFETPEHLYVILIWLLTTVISQILSIPINTFAGLTQEAKQDIPNLIQTCITQTLRILAVIIHPQAITLSLSYLLGSATVLPIYRHLFRNYPRGVFDKRLLNDYIRIAKPMILLVIFGIAIGYLDKVLLQYFTDSQQVGYYSAAFTIGSFIQMFSLSAGVLFFPIFSSAFARKDYEYLNKLIENFERFVYLFIMPLVIFLMLYSKTVIVFLLGKNYEPSGGILFVILAGIFFMIINQHYGNLIIGAGFFYQGAIINLYSLIFFVILNILFVMPHLLNLKALGSAFAWTINALFIGLLFRIYVADLIKEVNPWRNKKYILFGIINFLLFYILYKITNVEIYLIYKIIFPIIYITITYLLLFFLNLIGKNDLSMLKEVLSVKLLGRYIKSEIR